MAVRSYRDLEVWQKSMELVVECYHRTKSFPASERFGLIAQIRRCDLAKAYLLCDDVSRMLTGLRRSLERLRETPHHAPRTAHR